MILEFQKYLNNFYLSISGFWCLSQKDVREMLLKGRVPSTLDTSIGQPALQVDMYKISLTLPEAPFSKENRFNEIVEMQARLLIVACFDWLDEEFKLTENKIEFKSWPEIVKIFKCLRNASAHNNQFEFRDTVLKNLPLKWGEKTLTADDDKKSLFSRWMSCGDIEYFLEDVSKEIKL